MGASANLRSGAARVAIGLALALAASPAVAQSRAQLEQARKEFVQAQRDYQRGEFQKAIDELNDVLDVKESASVLFNLAQAHRELGELPQALFFYKRVVEEFPGSPEAKESQAWVNKLEAQSVVAAPAAPRHPSNPVVPPPPTTPPPAKAAAPVAPPPATPPGARLGEASQTPVPPAPAETPLYERWWFDGGIAVVVAGGVAATLLATRDTRMPSGSWGLLTPMDFGAK